MFPTEDVAVDPLAQQSPIDNEPVKVWQPFGVLTPHRPSNVGSTEKLAELLSAIDAIAQQVPIVFPLHPRTQLRLTHSGIKNHPQLRLIPPLGYLDFLYSLNKATLTLTDSGGIQEETPALGVPCLTLRENTERPVTCLSGTNVLVGTNPSKIVAVTEQILRRDGKGGRTPHSGMDVAERMVEILLRAGPRGRSRVDIT